MISQRLLSGLFLLLMCLGTAHAQTGTYDIFRTTGGTVVFTGPGPVTTIPPASAGQIIWDNAVKTDGGLPKVEGGTTAKNPSGNPVAVKGFGRIPAAKVAVALGNLFGRVAGPIVVASALWNFCKELDFGCNRAGNSGTITITKFDPNVCTVAPCYQYNTSVLATFYPSKSQACTASAESRSNVRFLYKGTVSGNVCHAEATERSDGSYAGYADWPIGQVSAPPVTDNPGTPSSLQELQDAIASKSGWPTSSTIGPLLEQAIAQSPKAIEIGPISLSGPASTPGTQKVTNLPNGNVKTETVTHNHTYEGNKITTTNVTNITNYNPVTNITETETSTETTPEKDPEEPPVDTALPEVPKLYERKYPEGLVGVWREQKAALTATPVANLMGKLMPSVGTGGSCPAWNLDFGFAVWADFGVRDVAPPCYVWDWGRLIILVSALLLARALIFGG